MSTVEDEDLLETVFQMFSERLENYFEEQEQEELSREGY